MTVEEFWEQEQPYIEKDLYAMAYTKSLQSDFLKENGLDEADALRMNIDTYQAYYRGKLDALKEKYHVEILFPF